MRTRSWVLRIVCVLVALVVAWAPLAGCSKGGSPSGAGAGTAIEGAADEATSTDDEETTGADASADDASAAAATDAASSPDKEQAPPAQSGTDATPAAAISEDGSYTSPEDVALYIHTYGHLPSNFISKTKARKQGWDSKAGNLDEVCPGMSIGGSVYYNEGWDGEELLPEAEGRTWTECDVNYHGGYRGAERLVFSNDGLIFYTDDHYKTFTQLY